MKTTNKRTEPREFTENTTLEEWLRYWLEAYVKPVSKPSGYARLIPCLEGCTRKLCVFVSQITLFPLVCKKPFSISVLQ